MFVLIVNVDIAKCYNIFSSNFMQMSCQSEGQVDWTLEGMSQRRSFGCLFTPSLGMWSLKDQCPVTIRPAHRIRLKNPVNGSSSVVIYKLVCWTTSICASNLANSYLFLSWKVCENVFDRMSNCSIVPLKTQFKYVFHPFLPPLTHFPNHIPPSTHCCHFIHLLATFFSTASEIFFSIFATLNPFL